ncbi:MAG: ribonuclease III [Chloroflexi bacterium AL-W]|nr:ribonuclease III [Chloroflexi bacterium AL-N1]NOK65675.1 ribonuclease III [Chloroflexi bacterium AL-N10]NOK74384.1 ribonuclease III [Chloroflexi bacterium AL-N5]NOK80708.1 ribonuclease III [Chloroflexi bacterium AL-W]NOK88642.1 ribonuclease III [Chloroflexi bacterium AL-N15]
MPSLNKLIDRLGVIFTDVSLLESALTHRSFVHEHPDQAVDLICSERLEFLGDSILNYIAADVIFAWFPEYNEGHLTSLRAALVRTSTLAQFAQQLDLGTYLRLSKGEEGSGARIRHSLLADTFEALLAAIYLDNGLEGVRIFITPLLEHQLEQIKTHGLSLDYKSRLQERLQAAYNITPVYNVIAAEGPDHQREFTVEVLANSQRLGVGQGRSKQAATQDAARAALESATDDLI